MGAQPSSMGGKEALEGLAECCATLWHFLLDGDDCNACVVAYSIPYLFLFIIQIVMFSMIAHAHSVDDLGYVRTQVQGIGAYQYDFSVATGVCQMLEPDSFYMFTDPAVIEAGLKAGCIYHSFFQLTEDQQHERAVAAAEAAANGESTSDYTTDQVGVAFIFISMLVLFCLSVFLASPRKVKVVEETFQDRGWDEKMCVKYPLKALLSLSCFLVVSLPMGMFLDTLLGDSCGAAAVQSFSPTVDGFLVDNVWKSCDDQLKAYQTGSSYGQNRMILMEYDLASAPDEQWQHVSLHLNKTWDGGFHGWTCATTNNYELKSATFTNMTQNVCDSTVYTSASRDYVFGSASTLVSMPQELGSHTLDVTNFVQNSVTGEGTSRKVQLTMAGAQQGCLSAFTSSASSNSGGHPTLSITSYSSTPAQNSTRYENVYKCEELFLPYVLYIPLGSMLFACGVANKGGETAALMVIAGSFLIMAIFAIINVVVANFDTSIDIAGAVFGGDFSFLSAEEEHRPRDDIAGLVAVLEIKTIASLVVLVAGFTFLGLFKPKPENFQSTHQKSDM